MQRSEVIIFFAKALSIYIVWYLLYDLWMLPDGRVDLWLSEHIVRVSGGFLSILGFDVYASGRIIGLVGTNMLEIIDGCNGIEVIGLFIGFVVAYPGITVNRFLFVPIGILLLYITNIVRIVVLSIVQLHAPGIFTVTHDYSTTAIFYLVVFALWVVWVNYGSNTFFRRHTHEAV
jgi:exosortase family protein XrtF